MRVLQAWQADLGRILSRMRDEPGIEGEPRSEGGAPGGTAASGSWLDEALEEFDEAEAPPPGSSGSWLDEALEAQAEGQGELASSGQSGSWLDAALQGMEEGPLEGAASLDNDDVDP